MYNLKFLNSFFFSINVITLFLLLILILKALTHTHTHWGGGREKKMLPYIDSHPKCLHQPGLWARPKVKPRNKNLHLSLPDGVGERSSVWATITCQLLTCSAAVGWIWTGVAGTLMWDMGFPHGYINCSVQYLPIYTLSGNSKNRNKSSVYTIIQFFHFRN